ncbi:hypothetical protein [Xenococcus sp. PCC 7305]|uniref:hypothetical protein n=1 Tax=Xenococcus sp. PCC 7305 TaxID=102125 RepID=UPI001181AC39|nr:hypothetical protein [Xenococcus sp. PCC 7305]
MGQLLLNMVGNFARSIANIFAKKAASSIFSVVFKTAVSSLSEGGTIENFEEGGTVENRIVPTPISDKLQQISAPIRNAFRREGNGGRLAVFTPGEEVLSIKTGEAGRYQGLKRELGINPLGRIFAGNFLDGGTIEANLLAGLDYRLPEINIRALEGRDLSAQNNTKIYNLSSTFVSPDLDSFKASEYQRQQE